MLAPEIVGIGTVGAGSELGDGTNTILAIDNLENECGVLSGVPGGFADVWCSAWGTGKDCGFFYKWPFSVWDDPLKIGARDFISKATRPHLPSFVGQSDRTVIFKNKS